MVRIGSINKATTLYAVDRRAVGYLRERVRDVADRTS